MNTIDYIYLGALIAALILGIWKGFLKQAFALVGIFIIAIGTTVISPHVSNWLINLIPSDGTRTIAAMIATFIILSVAYGIITKLLSKLVNGIAVLGWINRLLGAVFAIAVVYLVFAVLDTLLLASSENFLVGIKNLVQEPFAQSKIINAIYGGVENPEKNFFGNWLINIMREKLIQRIPQVPQEDAEAGIKILQMLRIA